MRAEQPAEEDAISNSSRVMSSIWVVLIAAALIVATLTPAMCERPVGDLVDGRLSVIHANEGVTAI